MDGMEDKLMNGAAVAKADLGFGRVDIDIDRGRVNLEENTVSRIATAVEHVLIGFAQRMAEQFVAYESSVYITVLGIVASTRMRGLRA